MYLQMIAAFAVADQSVSERGESFGFILMAVVTGETEGGHLGMSAVFDAFGGVARLRVEITGRASTAVGVLLSRLLQGLAYGLHLPFNREGAARRKINRVGDEAIPLDFADQPSDPVETPQVSIGLFLISGNGGRQVLIEELIHREILR